MRKRGKRKDFILDLFVVTTLVIFAATVSFIFRPHALVSILLFLAVPSLYLCLRRPKNYQKIVLSSIAFGVLAGMSWTFTAEFNDAWIVHYQNAILNYQLIGKTPIGNFVWAFFIPFFTITFYEHFLDDEHHYRISKHYKMALVIAGILFVIPVVRFLQSASVFHIAYAYLILGLLSILPLLYLIWAKPWLAKKVAVAALFFIFVNLLFEVVGLDAGFWTFPGEYIGWITVGAISFPIEELIFWIIPSAAVFLVCYELCFDDAA